VRKVEISAKHEKRSPRGSKNTHRDERARGVPALGERRDEKRGGNDAPWKAWKTPKNKTEFSTLPTGLGNPAKNKDAGFPHFHRADGGVISTAKDKK
jgi:hypothetical protein